MNTGFMYNTMSSASNDHFTSSLLIWIYYISLSCLIAVTRTSSTMLNRRGESGHPCLILDFSRKTFSFSPLSIMLAVGVSSVAFTNIDFRVRLGLKF
uniref:Uncharacterized protein n=2 Tax=Sus scrofa TaxID=9823 RepID=A0A8D0ZS76_PIG